MIKKFTSLVMAGVVATIIGATATAGNSRGISEFELTYNGVGETMWSDYGLGFDGTYSIGVAIVFPAERIKNYVGCELTQLRFGWNTNTYYPEADCFVRNSIEGEDLVHVVTTFEQSDKDAAYWLGTWNDVELPSSVIIEEGKDIVIGYFLETEATGANETSIPVSSLSTYYENTQFMINYSVPEEEGGSQWFSLYDDWNDRPTSPIFASAMLVDRSGSVVDLFEVSSVYTQPIISTEHSTPGMAIVANRGTNDIDNITIKYSFGDLTATEDVTLAERLVSGDKTTISIPFRALGTGKHQLEVIEANGNPNSIAEPYEYDVIGVPAEISDNYTMTPLLEYFCSETDYRSIRYYEEILRPGFEENGDKIVKVNQHLSDQFSLNDPYAENQYDDASTMLIDYCDGDIYGVYVPAMTVNRTAFPNVYTGSMPDKPSEPVIYPRFVNQILYNPALQTPTFASIEIPSVTNEMADLYKVVVKTSISDQVLPEGEKLFLTVYVVEDSVFSTSQEMPDDPEFVEKFPDGYYQKNIIRATLTPMYGKAVGFGDNLYSFECSIDPAWDKQELSFVAFLSRDPANDRYNRNVINSCQVRLDQSSGIPGQVSSEARDTRIYDLKGMEVEGENLAPGIYVVREIDANGTVTTRKIVR